MNIILRPMNIILGKLARPLARPAWEGFKLAYGLVALVVTVAAAGWRGGVFTKNSRMSEEERKELVIAQEMYWSLSKQKQPIPGFEHEFCTSATGIQMHYIVNAEMVEKKAKSVVIFVHGFPDSCFLWRNILASLERSNEDSALIAVDLPGYGGSGSLDVYDASTVFEAMTGFILQMRERYLEEDGKVVVVAHDWGTIISMRLASEAGVLADRWILTSGVIPEHLKSNVESLLTSSKRMLHTFAAHPTNIRLLKTALFQLLPIASQLLKSFYIFIFNLPYPLACFFATFGNFWFLRLTHRIQAPLNARGKRQECLQPKSSAKYLAAVLPGDVQLSMLTVDGYAYPGVKNRNNDFGMGEKIRLYREGLALGTWEKSIESIVALSELAGRNAAPAGPGRRRRRSSMSRALFDEGPVGALRAPATIIYGRKDSAFEPRLCLNGLGDYIGRDSQVFVLRNGGHWLPNERVGSALIEHCVRMEIDGGGVTAGGVEEWGRQVGEVVGREVEVLVNKE